jgi:hypothetical protein
MKIRAFTNIIDSKYSVTIYTEDFSEGDKQLMIKFGEPSIDVGGTFTGFTLPNQLRSLAAGFPYTKFFDFRDNASAATHAATFLTTIKTRISSAVSTLRANTDAFTSEDVTIV